MADIFPYPNNRKTPYHLSVGAVVRTNADGVLLIRRESGTYILPTETLKEKETLLDALHRGLLEETGVTADVICFLGTTEMPFNWYDKPVEEITRIKKIWRYLLGSDGFYRNQKDYQKTMLWHEMKVTGIDDSKKAADDVEAEGHIVWVTKEEALAIFKQQGQELGGLGFLRCYYETQMSFIICKATENDVTGIVSLIEEIAPEIFPQKKISVWLQRNASASVIQKRLKNKNYITFVAYEKMF